MIQYAFILIAVIGDGGIAVEFRDQQMCEEARAAIIAARIVNKNAAPPYQAFAVCVKK